MPARHTCLTGIPGPNNQSNVSNGSSRNVGTVAAASSDSSASVHLSTLEHLFTLLPSYFVRSWGFGFARTLTGLALLGFFPGCDSGQVGIAESDRQHASLQDTTLEPNEPATPEHEGGVGLADLTASGSSPSDKVSRTAPVSSRPAPVNPVPVTPVSLASTSDARQWLDAVIDRYQRADRYSDRGYVRLAYRRLGQQHEDKAPLSVSFVRNRALHLQAYAADIVIWQGRFQATITDALTNNFDSQVIDRTVGTTGISLAEIYSDPELTHFASAGLGGPSPQLELLLSEKPLAGLFEGSANLLLGTSEKISLFDPITNGPKSYNCKKLTIDTDSLKYHLWIDSETGLVRRIELPAAAAGLDADPSVTDVRLTIEMEGAAFGTDSSERFALPADKLTGADVKRVKTFVPLPPPMISELLGKRTPEFALSSADGNLVASERGSDRATTVLLWIADHPASRMAAAQLQIVADARETAGNKDSRIVVVMAEPRIMGSAADSDTLINPQSESTRPPSTTGALLRSWKVGLPYVDDFKAVGRDVFNVAEAPTLVVLGPTGTVEWFQPRVGPDIAVQLPMLLDDLAKGKEVGKEIRGRYEADQQMYKKLLSEAASN